MNHSALRIALFTLFTLSGFCGLIYESIWTHYLKLFLGHAAYAQTLVLAIFMGGMAIGAWICGTRSTRWGNLLLGYAIAEGLIGIAALIFHPIFDGYIQYAYTTLLPAVGNPSAITLLKWGSAALLILPQSVLLGMTFPLMSSALIRRFPETPGETVAMLYFTNSIGAAIGVLVSGFVLIEAVGLPGTISFAGALNLVLAAIVWVLARKGSEPAFPASIQQLAEHANNRWRLIFLAVALLTGTASFIYEIAWIRMLSLVLSSSTHAFELMLSVFVLGLALGGLWIKRRIGKIADPVRFLATVQIIMGMLALATLPIYNQSFDAMHWLLSVVPRTDMGYIEFNLASHAIAAAVMLPATFCAGMTLPLITYTLIQHGHGEKAIGQVYAVNTLGAIIGVFFATHLGMPLLGLKNVLAVGAGMDIAVGIAMVWYFVAPKQIRWAQAWTGLGVGALVVILVTVELNPYKMASGVYRNGAFVDAGDAEILFHQDGKTASIDVLQYRTNKTIAIGTNGKPDASINMTVGGEPSPDELTMILAGVLPLSMRPNATSAAVIGFGSGLTTHTLADAAQLTSVDTIEIEAAMVTGAQHFRPRVEQAYSEQKSKIHIDDAKTFFSSRNAKYDIIVSEPSNPWVSGVSNLFTEEFYKLSKRHLNQDGILVQWMQLYEIDTKLVASVVKALSMHYANYVVYAANDIDMLLVASDSPLPLEPSPRIFSDAHMADILHRQGIRNMHDLRLHRIGDRHALQPLFDSYSVAMNSDYNPVLDTNAAQSRFITRGAEELMKLLTTPGVPLTRLLAPVANDEQNSQYTPTAYLTASVAAYDATLLYKYIVTGQSDSQYEEVTDYLKSLARNLRSGIITCETRLDDTAAIASVLGVAQITLPFLSMQESHNLWTMARSSPCFSEYPDTQQSLINLMLALAARDSAEIYRIATALLTTERASNPALTKFLLQAGMFGAVALEQKSAAQALWNNYASAAYPTHQYDPLTRVYMAYAGISTLTQP